MSGIFDRDQLSSRIEEVLEVMEMKGNLIDWARYGNGHINDTFLVIKEYKGIQIKYILQRINHYIFKNPMELISNIYNVTIHMKSMIETEEEKLRNVLTLLSTKDGSFLYQDSIGSYWRAYHYIGDSYCVDKIEEPLDFYECGLSFGNFQYLLKDFDSSSLYETIPNFHNTPKRYEHLLNSIKMDKANRVKECQEEIRFISKRCSEFSILTKLLEDGKLPLRVTHNDTKLNNIMFDRVSRKGICIVDFDTIMPGLSLYDFGDSIRFGANTALEDEVDLSKVSLDRNLFSLYTKGFIEGSKGILSADEIRLLPMGAKLMTMECAIRFLMDYLDGDIYFKVGHETHNIERCRNQLALVKSMEEQWDDMVSIVKQYVV